MMHDNDALGVATGTGEVRIERWLPGPLERVWAYLTESDKRGKWLAPGEMELRVGGRVEHNFFHADLSHEKVAPPAYQAIQNGHRMEGTVTAIDPPRLLAYSWGNGVDDSEVTFELSPAAGGEVRLVVTHRRLQNKKMMANVAGGWHAHLGILLDQLEGREPRGFWSTLNGLEERYAARFAEMENEPALAGQPGTGG